MNFISGLEQNVTILVHTPAISDYSKKLPVPSISADKGESQLPRISNRLLGTRIFPRNVEMGYTEFKSSIFDDVTPFEILMKEEFSDVNLVIGTNIIAVHQIILASHSNYLDNILNDHNKLKEYGINENLKLQEKFHFLDKTSIVLSEFSLESVTRMVHFLYSGELISEANGLEKLLILAKSLQMTFLESQILELKSRLSENDDSHLNNNSSLCLIKDGNVNIVAEDVDVQNSTDLNNASFITLEGLENLGNGEVIIDEEMVVQNDNVMIIEKELVEKTIENTDLETPIQSPANENEMDEVNTQDLKNDGSYTLLEDRTDHQVKGETREVVKESSLETVELNDIATDADYVQCDLCHISCTDVEYLKRHKKAKHNIDLLGNMDGVLFTCSLCEFSTHTKSSLAEHSREQHSNKTHQCDICHKFFISMSKLEEHKLAHTGEKSFVCNICGRAFSRSYHLKVHNRIHTGEKPYKCGQCDRTFVDSSALRGHMRSHSEDKPHKCKLCEKGFKDKGNLKQHEATHKSERPYKCKVCGQSFTFKRNMVRHSEIHAQTNKPMPNPNTIYKCEFCDNVFTSESCLLEHNQEEHPNFTANTNNIVFKCYHRNCDRVFPSEKMFKSHFELVHEEKGESKEQGPFSCQYCGVQFINIKTLRQHSKTSHSSVGTFKCALCNKGFKNECDLKSHMKDHTDKRKKYICNYCSKAWDRPSDLVKHMRVHTGEKPFQCKDCDKKFADKSLFLKHTRTHNSPASIYVCGICDKKFQIEANLEKHLKTHTAASYACSSCGKKFFDEISLGAHINMHNGALPYNCSFCNKEFGQLSDLKKHERIHTGEKPYKCEHCEKQFSDNSALKKHERRHLKVSSNEQFQCLGCGKTFLKEEAFFKHATLFGSGSHKNKKCHGKPKVVPDNFPPTAIVRCLNCKITLQHTEDIKLHLENPNCKGPIYAKVSGHSSILPSDPDNDMKIVNISDKNISHHDTDATETLTTIVEIEPVKYPSDNSVMKVITQLNEMAEAIQTPKSQSQIQSPDNLKIVKEDKENLF